MIKLGQAAVIKYRDGSFQAVVPRAFDDEDETLLVVEDIYTKKFMLFKRDMVEDMMDFQERSIRQLETANLFVQEVIMEYSIRPHNKKMRELHQTK